jgi:hypothetical protein
MAIATGNSTRSERSVHAVLTNDPGFLRRLVEETLQQIFEMVSTGILHGEQSERREIEIMSMPTMPS